MPNSNPSFSQDDLSRIIEMAWEDRKPFEAIEANFGTSEGTVIQIMRSQLKPSAFRSWRKRVSSRKTKHLHLRPTAVSRGYCSTQYFALVSPVHTTDRANFMAITATRAFKLPAAAESPIIRPLTLAQSGKSLGAG